VRENCTSRLIERTEEGSLPDLLRLYTNEAGEAAPRDPVEGRGSQTYRPGGGKDVGNPESHHRLNARLP